MLPHSGLLAYRTGLLLSSFLHLDIMVEMRRPCARAKKLGNISVLDHACSLVGFIVDEALFSIACLSFLIIVVFIAH
jgi:hypothetical protein